MNQTWTDILTISIPIAAPTLALASYGLKKLAEILHASRLATIASAASTAAGNISIEMSKLPPGTDLNTARTALVADATAELKTQFASLLASTKYPDATLSNKISGAVGNNPLHAAVVADSEPPAATVVVNPVPVSLVGGEKK